MQTEHAVKHMGALRYSKKENTPLIYRLDPRTKFFCLVMYSILALIFFQPSVNFVIFLAVPLVWLHARIRGAKAKNLLVSTLVYALIIFCSQILMLPQKINNSAQSVELDHLLQWGFLDITDVSLQYAATITMRMCVPLLAALLVILTSDSMDIVRAFSKMGLPPSIILVIASTFRLMPLAMEEMKNIQEAQKVRGLKASKIGVLKASVFPWLVNLLRMAHNIGISVESKGFSNRKRATSLYKDPEFAKVDFVVMAVSVLILLSGMVIRFGFGFGAAVMQGIT